MVNEQLLNDGSTVLRSLTSDANFRQIINLVPGTAVEVIGSGRVEMKKKWY